MSGWISVKDRLPDENEQVIGVWVNRNPPSYYANIKDKPNTSAMIYIQGNWYWWSVFIEDFLEYGSEAVRDFKISEDIEITHWMPLPELPESEGEYHEEVQGIHQV